MKVRTILAAAAIAIAAVGGTAGVVVISGSWSTLSRESAASDLATGFPRVLVIPQRLLQEHTAFTHAVQPAEIGAAQRTALGEARRATDAAITAAREPVPRHDPRRLRHGLDAHGSLTTLSINNNA